MPKDTLAPPQAMLFSLLQSVQLTRNCQDTTAHVDFVQGHKAPGSCTLLSSLVCTSWLKTTYSLIAMSIEDFEET